MDRKTKILIFVFFCIIAASVGFTFYKYVILEDYYIKMQTSCDPSQEKCFVSKCSVGTDSSCPTEEAEQYTYYKIIDIKANLLPSCDAKEGDCPEVFCKSGQDCQETFCASDNVPEGETCSVPTSTLNLDRNTDLTD